jgi:hypothetical protein
MARLRLGIARSVLAVALAAQAATPGGRSREQHVATGVGPGLARLPPVLAPIAEAAQVAGSGLLRRAYDFQGFRPFDLIAYYLARAVHFLYRTALTGALTGHTTRNQ